MAIQLPHASSTMNWREDFQNGDSVIPKLKRNATFNAAHSKTTYLLNRLDCVSNNALYFWPIHFPVPSSLFLPWVPPQLCNLKIILLGVLVGQDCLALSSPSQCMMNGTRRSSPATSWGARSQSTFNTRPSELIGSSLDCWTRLSFLPKLVWTDKLQLAQNLLEWPF